MTHAGKWFLAAVAWLGFAGAAPAADPKSPDLSDLKDAVKAAARRGDNVGEIGKAVGALEKFLAKGWNATKGGTVSAPPELAAVREAVDAAAKRGENVEAIRAELEAVEKAMTGQTLAKPRPEPPPEPKVEYPPPAGRGRVVIQGGGGIMVVNGAQIGGRAMSLTIANGEFTLRSAQNGVRYVLTGTIGADGPVLEKVTVADGDKKPVEAASLKDVPADHRDTVERLLKGVGVRRFAEPPRRP